MALRVLRSPTASPTNMAFPDTNLHGVAFQPRPARRRGLPMPRTGSPRQTPVGAFRDILLEDIRRAGGQLMMVSTMKSCCVCFCESEEGSFAYLCSCSAAMCANCLDHLVHTMLADGVLPECCACAKRPIPTKVIKEYVDSATLQAAVTLRVNSKLPKDDVLFQTCRVCSRVNDVRGACLDQSVGGGGGVRTTRTACGHCGVGRCFVCSGVYPHSTDDALVHEACVEKLPTFQRFARFMKLLELAGIRICPLCKKGGVKNESCTHMSCCGSWCYVCGKRNCSGVYELERWIDNPEACIMYLHHLAHFDERISKLGCGRPDCRPKGDCQSDKECRVERDAAAQALLATIRVRYNVLMFAEREGKAEFVAMLDAFNWRDVVDKNYFNGMFPWDGDELPAFHTFEPESVREHYAARSAWFTNSYALDAVYAGPPAPRAPAPPPPPLPPAGWRAGRRA